jgi:hypothetical protein
MCVPPAGSNGDIAAHARRWREALDRGDDLSRVENRLAVASLVSVHDGIWTTDRAGAARRWAAIDPASAPDMRVLVDWAEGPVAASLQDVERVLEGTVARVVRVFRDDRPVVRRSCLMTDLK